MAVKCAKCGFGGTIEQEKEIHRHHVVPKSIGGADLDGTLWLCKKCHDVAHNYYPKLMWGFIPDEKKEECKKHLADWFKYVFIKLRK